MNLSDISGRFLGAWKGTKELYFSGPPTPDSVSDSDLVVGAVAMGKFLSFAYTWTFKGKAQEGFLLLSGKDGKATAAWVDSFHMSADIQVSKGHLDEEGKADVVGSYSAPPGPDWGWRTQIESDGERLVLTMFNIEPEAEEVLAVKAIFDRS